MAVFSWFPFKRFLKAIVFQAVGILFLLQPVYSDIMINFPLYFLQSNDPAEQTAFSLIRAQIEDNVRREVAQYENLPADFSDEHGKGASLSSHLTMPIGAGPIRQEGVVSIGFGVGVGLPRARSFYDVLPGRSRKGALARFRIIPTLGMGVMGGYALTSNWDFRFAFLPLTDISLPSFSDEFTNRIKSSTIKLASNYRLLGQDKKIWGFGLSLGGYFTYSTGAVALNLNRQRRQFEIDGNSIQLDLTALQLNSKWEYYSGGAEVRVDYALFFFIPYVGSGLGLEYGRVKSNIDIRASMDGSYEVPTVGPFSARTINIVEETGQVLIQGRTRASIIPFRVFVGFELNFYKFSFVVEIQYFVNHSVPGASIAANLLI